MRSPVKIKKSKTIDAEKSLHVCVYCGINNVMEEPTSNQSTCLGYIDGKQCLQLISSDSNFCTNCGTKNPDFFTDQSANSKEEKGTAEISSFIGRSEDEDHNDKLSLNEQCDVLSDAQSTIRNNDHDPERGSVSDRSDDEDQTDTWNVDEKLDSTSLSNGEQVTESDEVLMNEKHFTEKASFSGEQVKKSDEVLLNEKHSTEIGLSSDLDAETLEDEILKDIGLGSIKNEVFQIFKTDGPKNAVEYLNANASMWKYATVRIAVAGKSSVGKSTFINAIREVNSTDEGSAEEGLGDTTLVVQEYRHPKNKKIIYCDLPGYGTVTMTRETFLEKVNLLEYDIFFIFIYPVPTQDDQWLTEQLRKVDKEFCFVRAKLDCDLKNIKRMGKAEEDVIAEIRGKIRDATNSMSTKKEDIDIFLISNWNFEIGEIVKLVSFVEAKLPKLMFEAIAFCFSSIAKEMVEVKYKMLQNRISSLALMLAWSDNYVRNYSYAAGEIEVYYEAFALDKVEDKLQRLNLRHPFSADYINTLLSRLNEELPGVLKQVVPIYSTVVLYRSYKRFFQTLLDELKDDFYTLNTFIITERIKNNEMHTCSKCHGQNTH